MISIIFSIYDSKAEAAPSFFLSQNRATAIRSFAESAMKEESSMYNNGGDFTLFELGTFDHNSMKIIENKTQENLGTALSHMRPLTGWADVAPDVPTSGIQRTEQTR